MTTFAERRERVREKFDADALLVTSPTNVRYLTGFTGSNGQLLLADESAFFTDGRYIEQSAEQVPDLERTIYRQGQTLHAFLAEAVAARRIGSLAIEAAHTTVAE